MREILFRGKTVYNDIGWVYGSLITSMKGIIPCIVTDVGVGDKNDLDYKFEYVDSKTISQFTGLCDRKGVKIFEGDIVKIYTKNPTIAQVVFSVENGFLFEIIKYIDKSMIGERVKRTDFRCNIVDFYDKGIEVIGNIYDNPELLENCDEQI